MINSSKQTPTLLNTIEIVENESRGSLTPLQWNKEKFPGWSQTILRFES